MFSFVVLLALLMSWLLIWAQHKLAVRADRTAEWVALYLLICLVVVADLILINELARHLAMG